MFMRVNSKCAHQVRPPLSRFWRVLQPHCWDRSAVDDDLAAMNRRGPGRLTFCYVSGEGTDGTERGRTMWARVKGKTENALLGLPFKAAVMFRPGYIQPLRGLRSKTRWYQALYDVMGPFYPILRRLFPRYVTTTVNIGRAMIHVAATGSSKQNLSSADINQLSG